MPCCAYARIALMAQLCYYLIIRSYDCEEAESPKCGFIGAEPQLYASIHPRRLRSAEK